MTDQQQPEEQPKIIIDDDWKKQAQAEKEKIAEEVKAAEAAEASGDQTQPEAQEGAAPEGQDRQIPPASFTTLVGTIYTQAMMCLGAVADPNGEEKGMIDLEVAKHHIDTLKVIEEKTKGNLDEEESKIMEDVSYQVQMRFVQIIQHLSGQQPGQAPTPENPGAQPSN